VRKFLTLLLVQLSLLLAATVPVAAAATGDTAEQHIESIDQQCGPIYNVTRRIFTATPDGWVEHRKGQKGLPEPAENPAFGWADIEQDRVMHVTISLQPAKSSGDSTTASQKYCFYKSGVTARIVESYGNRDTRRAGERLYHVARTVYFDPAGRELADTEMVYGTTMAGGPEDPKQVPVNTKPRPTMPRYKTVAELPFYPLLKK
jgi:hypothetical protein